MNTQDIATNNIVKALRASIRADTPSEPDWWSMAIAAAHEQGTTEAYQVWLAAKMALEHNDDERDVADDECGFCHLPGADKVPHPHLWPGEHSAGSRYVHAACENEECARAHAALSDKERVDALREIMK